jgi:hypothetical protein
MASPDREIEQLNCISASSLTRTLLGSPTDGYRERVFLYDRTGRRRGSFTLSEAGPQLELRNAEGKVVLSLSESRSARAGLRR